MEKDFRHRMRKKKIYFRLLTGKTNLTILSVTPDIQIESLMLYDEIIVMDAGQII